MEELLFWLALLLKFLKRLFPFLIGVIMAILAFKLIGKPPSPYWIPIFLLVTLAIGLELKILFREIIK